MNSWSTILYVVLVLPLLVALGIGWWRSQMRVHVKALGVTALAAVAVVMYFVVASPMSTDKDEAEYSKAQADFEAAARNFEKEAANP